MNWLNAGATAVFDLVLGPVQGHPAWAMLLVSALTGVWALLLFKATTPQRRLAVARDRLMGHIYEMGLYQDHLGVLARIQGRLALANLRYISLTLPALLALMVPMILTLAQLEGRFAHRPLRPGEEAVVTVELDGDGPRDVALDLPAGLVVTAGPVQDRKDGAVAWRVKASGDGEHTLGVQVDGSPAGRIDLRVGGGLPLLGKSSKRGAWHALLFPGAEPLPADRPVKRLAVQLPEREVAYLGIGMDWLVAFCVLSLIVGLALKDVFKVKM